MITSMKLVISHICIIYIYHGNLHGNKKQAKLKAHVYAIYSNEIKDGIGLKLYHKYFHGLCNDIM